MLRVFRCIQGEEMKSRHTLIPVLHLLFPLFGAGAFAGYFHISGWDETTNIAVFLEAIAMVIPFAMGIISAMEVQLEEEAGHFQMLLGTIPSRGTVYMGKCLYLIMWCGFSTALCIFLFALLYPAMSLSFYIKPFVMLLLSGVPLYLLSLLIGFSFGRGCALGIGITGSLLSALFATGLGDFVWKFLPWGWGIRLAEYCVLEHAYPEQFYAGFHEMQTGFFIMIFFTVLLFVGSFWWSERWEGK